MDLSHQSRYVLGLNADGSPQLLYDTGESAGYLAYDTEECRLVEIHRPLPGDPGGNRRFASTRERLNLALKVRHPNLAAVLETGENPENQFYYVTEFVEGERIRDYLDRVPALPQPLGLSLVLQLADLVACLSNFPRLLSAIVLEDFSITLSRGRFLSIRLADYGFEREERPLRDSELAARWIENIGLLLMHLMDGRPLPRSEEIEYGRNTGGLTGPLGYLIGHLRHQSGGAAVEELRNLKRTLLRAAGIGDASLTFGAYPEFASVTDKRLLPHGPICRLIFDSGELEDLFDERWRIQSDEFPPDGLSPFTVRAKSRTRPQDPNGKARRFDLQILPPERLIGNTVIPSTNQKMGHSYFKEHPNLTRTRCFVCGGDFTVLENDCCRGFSLMTLVTQRRRLNGRETHDILTELERLRVHLDGGELDPPEFSPWSILFHFEEAPPERVRNLLTTTPIADWPATELKLRIERTTDAMVESVSSAWRYLLRRMNRKSLAALAVWMMEGDRFETALALGQADSEPLSTAPSLNDIFEKAARYLDENDREQRRRFNGLLLELTMPPLLANTAEAELIEAELVEDPACAAA